MRWRYETASGSWDSERERLAERILWERNLRLEKDSELGIPKVCFDFAMLPCY